MARPISCSAKQTYLSAWTVTGYCTGLVCPSEVNKTDGINVYKLPTKAATMMEAAYQSDARSTFKFEDSNRVTWSVDLWRMVCFRDGGMCYTLTRFA